MRDAGNLGRILQLAVAVRGAAVAVERVVGHVQLDDASAQLPDARRVRAQEPKAFSESVAHSLGMRASASAAARITEVPAGTVTVAPSISSVTCSSDFAGGVPRSR
jgi:hypothetical protein